MGLWVEQEIDEAMPEWLKTSLVSKCPYCGHAMQNYYNDVGRCTNRRCSNNMCIGMLAARADFVRKLIGIEGVGFKTCLNDIRVSKSSTVFQLLNFWNVKPTVPLSTFLRMHCIEGIDNEWEDIVQTEGVYSLDELYDKYNGKRRGLLDAIKGMLYSNLEYVNIIGRPDDLVKSGPRKVYTIMITGTPIGFASKDDFLYQVNAACRGLIIVKHQKTKRQSGVDCLIREPGSNTRGKVEAAMKGGIPILTSSQFIQFLTKELEKINSERID